MKVALITGSAKRTGKHLAKAFAQKGYYVWVHYLHSEKEAKETLDEIKSEGGDGHIIQGDISLLKDVKRMHQTIKRVSSKLDLLINNVGIYITGNLLHYEVKDFEYTINTNLTGSYYVIKELLELFSNEGGSIINIGYSGTETLAAAPYNTAYTISKTGLYILTKSYAAILGPKNIRINMISPGQLENSVDLTQETKDFIPLKRVGSLEDIANVALFLVSPKASYITGTNIDVAGGYMMSLQKEQQTVENKY